MAAKRIRTGWLGRVQIFGLAVTVALLAGGCGGDGDNKPEGGQTAGIRILEPQPGQVVRTHSTHFAVSLSGALDPSGLRVALNGQDVSSHARLNGLEAEGFASGMVPGSNTLLVAAPRSSGGEVSAEVVFTFDPVPIEAVEAKESLQIEGLDGPVEVLIDPWGVPHIYTTGGNPDDLLRVQGYLVARHRLFQIDFLRKVAQGRLAELFGTALDPSVLETDLFLRTMFLTYEGGRVRHVDEALVEEMMISTPEAFEAVGLFVEGVNAYIEDLKEGRNGATLSQQHKLLNLLGPYEIEPMTVEQVAAIGRLLQYQLSSTLTEEIERKLMWDWVLDAEAAAAIPEGTLLDVFRAKPPDPATILAEGEPGYVGPASAGLSAARFEKPSTRAATSALATGASGMAMAKDRGESQTLGRALERLRRVERHLPNLGEKPFSNNWILSPAVTASGFAILCNDPHLSLSNPSIFYPVHGDNKSFDSGDLNFSGCTFPGIPGLMLGMNEHLAWGGTVVGYDVEDVYEETVETGPDGLDRVLFQGEWVPVETIQETFRIRGGSAVVIPIDYVPHHGPQVPGDPYAADPTLTAENNLTVRWTGHFVTRDLAAFYGLLNATGIDDFQAAVANFGVGAQNFVGADVNGEIAYYPHALVPLRSPAALTPENPPYLPMPGTGGYEWLDDGTGRPAFLPPEEIPQVRNPERGWLVTANNDVTGTVQDNDALNDGVYLYYSTNPGFRGGRITQRLLALQKDQRDLEKMKEIQSDHVSLIAERVRPFLLEAAANPEATEGLSQETLARVEEAVGRIQAWDLRCAAGMPDPFTGEEPSAEDVESSVAASLFFVWLNRATQEAFDDEFAGSPVGLGSDERVAAFLHILEDVAEPEGSVSQVHTLGPDGQSLLWDKRDTLDKRETRDEILVQALVRALQDLEGLMGSADMETWRWGKIHTLTFRLDGLGSVLFAYNLPSYSILDQLFGDDLKGYPRSGGYQTVDPANYGLGGLDFSTGSGPAMRMVVELEEGVMQAWNVLPGGVNDLQPQASILNPVKIDAATHYGDQIPLWLSNQYRPQLLFWEDVTSVAESRIRIDPR